MDKTKLKDRQIEIWKSEQELASVTHLLLSDMIDEMTEDERKKLEGYRFEEYREIVRITPDEIHWRFTDDDLDDEPYRLALVNFNQVIQKDIIDFIMMSIWRM
jgi:hypothetical protein